MAFFAIRLPEEVQAIVDAGLVPLRERFPAMQWVHPKDYHLTLRFLGGLPQQQIQELVARCEQMAPRVPVHQLALGRLSVFMRRHQHGVLWLGIVDAPPELLRLQRELDAFVSAAGSPEDGLPFVPHITVARFSDREAADLGEFVASGAWRLTAQWSVDKYALMKRRSGQVPNGDLPLYDSLHVVSLMPP